MPEIKVMNSSCSSNHQSVATSCEKSNRKAPGLGLVANERELLECRDGEVFGDEQADRSLSARSSIFATGGGSSIVRCGAMV